MEVTARDYRFEHPSQVPAGRVVLRVQNRGSVEHELVLIRIPEELKGTLESQLRSPDRIAVTTLALAGRLKPGGNTTFAIEGTPGRYAMICFLSDPQGTQHALKGMTSEFLVTPLISPPPLLQPRGRS